ncbi:MAG: subclass B1 metallo-beta-lactamase [bacterium]|nr:subclass B1 metallo-beta-lactamase [bacterium]
MDRLETVRKCLTSSAAVALLVIAAATFAATEPAEIWLPLGEDLRIRRLAEDLWLHESDTEWGQRTVPANGLIVRGRRGVMVVDTPWTEDQTARLLDWITENLEAPVLGVVGTHFHPDAFGGIAEVHRRGIMTWGHALTGDLAAEQDREAPRQSFEDRWGLSLGDERVEAVYLGPGHSPDGLMVWLPARRILYAGCAVKALDWKSLGYLADADLAHWPATLRAAETFEAETVIPGHGSPGGPELLAHTLGLLEQQDAPSGP